MIMNVMSKSQWFFIGCHLFYRSQIWAENDPNDTVMDAIVCDVDIVIHIS